MLSLPNADDAVIDPRKLADYLLARSHPVGRHKARFFEALGFAADRAEILERALRDHAKQLDSITTQDTSFGTKYIADGMLRGPITAAHVHSIWIVERGTAVPRFVTAYPWS
jgi:hypothetical protein